MQQEQIESVKLVKTCNACPEQYDIMLDNTLIGYIRFRFGFFVVNPAIAGEYHFEIPLIEHYINDDYAGVIPDQFREKWLEEAKLKALEFYESD